MFSLVLHEIAWQAVALTEVWNELEDVIAGDVSSTLKNDHDMVSVTRERQRVSSIDRGTASPGSSRYGSNSSSFSDESFVSYTGSQIVMMVSGGTFSAKIYSKSVGELLRVREIRASFCAQQLVTNPCQPSTPINDCSGKNRCWPSTSFVKLASWMKEKSWGCLILTHTLLSCMHWL